MGRPKGSKNKPKVVMVGRRPHDIHFHVPHDTLKYQGKRLLWAVLEMEKKMSNDITSVKMSEYTSLLQAYMDVTDRLKERDKNAPKKRVVTKGSDSGSTEQDGSAGTSQDGQADLGAGVPAVNPIT